ncbi:MAG: MBL fold metallo-hydrolase, partial [Chloroflexi bacterium]|nr:MBL fold metallo-hydrolase [Chloroflexota bacterium]
MKPAVLFAFLLSVSPAWLMGCASAPSPTATPRPTSAPTATPSPTPGPLTLQFIGNSCTLITAPDGTRIVSDPYGYSRPVGLRLLPPGDLEADAVTVSHTHPDHNNVKAVGGEPQVITEPGTYQVGAVKVTGYASREGSPTGPSATMRNVVFVFEVGGAKIVHLGDGGPITEPDILAAVEGADIILVNIDGYVYPLDQILPDMQRINARTIIPTHYSIREDARWGTHMTLTIEEYLATLPSDMVVVRADSRIQVTPGMPKQVAALAP